MENTIANSFATWSNFWPTLLQFQTYWKVRCPPNPPKNIAVFCASKLTGSTENIKNLNKNTSFYFHLFIFFLQKELSFLGSEWRRHGRMGGFPPLLAKIYFLIRPPKSPYPVWGGWPPPGFLCDFYCIPCPLLKHRAKYMLQYLPKVPGTLSKSYYALNAPPPPKTMLVYF